MTPDERQLISGLFDRMRNVGSQSRDREAEQLIADEVRQQPHAPYLLTQTVLVQDQALKAANDRILQLEDEARRAQPAGQDGGGSFLGGIGRMFGGGQDPRGSVPAAGARQPDPGAYRGQGYGQPQGSPWGNQGAQPGGGLFGGGGGGGGFMKGALGAAAGVAGGVLLADGIRNLFSGGHNDPFGMTSGMGGFGAPGGETIINNNYYDTPQDNQDVGDQGGGDAGGYSNAGDYSSNDDGGSDPGSYT